MARIFLQHRVADYAKWRPIYDGDRPRREAGGMRDIAVFRDSEDPNNLLLVWDADQLDGFNAMLESDDLKAKMEEAGVVSAPEFWVTN